MNYRILNLPIDPETAAPTVRGALEVDAQTRGLWTCKGKLVPGINTKRTYENYATLIWLGGGDEYVVFSDHFDTIDPLNKGLKIKDVEWPWRVIEYLHDADGNITGQVETNVPTIPTEIGGSGMTAMIRKEPLKAEAIPL